MPRYPRKRERNVSKSIGAAVCSFALIAAGGVAAQGMLLDFAADKVIKKYEAATCERLKAQKDEPRTEREKMAIEFLRNDSQARGCAGTLVPRHGEPAVRQILTKEITMSQSHFTLSFSLKSPTDAKAVAQELPPLMPDLFRAEDTIGTVHYSRFTVLSDRTLLFLGDFDGDFGPLMRDLARRAGPVFDLIFKHVSDPPPMPVASNADAFTEWAAGHLLSPAYVFSAYPGPTVKEIKAMASAAGVEGRTQMLPFLVILPAKGRLAFAEMQLILRTMAMTGKVDRDMTSVGTPHFAQFVPLEDQQLGFFTVYDGAFDKYIMDFTRNIGEVFDLIFKFTKDPPPSPCRKHVQEFIDFAAGASRDPIGFYQAYPGLSNQDIKALIADSGTKAA